MAGDIIPTKEKVAGTGPIIHAGIRGGADVARCYGENVSSRFFASWALLSCSAAIVACDWQVGYTGTGGSGGATHATSSSSSSSSSGTTWNPDGGGTGGGAVNMCAGGKVGGDRPADVRVPASYDCKTPLPLVILLHDYASSGVGAEAYLDLAAQADARGFIYVHPDGTKDSKGKAFWNATDACCDAEGSGVDDSGYLSSLIWDIRAQYNVDPKRVYLIGYENGGFMAYREACDHATQITAVASLGGAMWADTAKCALKAPVSVLEIHGTADADIAYGGGTRQGHPYPGADTAAADWAKLDKCKSGPDTSAPPLDLDSSLPGAETTVTRFPTCVLGTSVELWKIQGGTHAPQLSTTFTSSVLDFLLAHHKP